MPLEWEIMLDSSQPQINITLNCLALGHLAQATAGRQVLHVFGLASRHRHCCGVVIVGVGVVLCNYKVTFFRIFHILESLCRRFRFQVITLLEIRD